MHITAPQGSAVTVILRSNEQVWNTSTSSWESEDGLTIGSHLVTATEVVTQGGVSVYKVPSATATLANAATSGTVYARWYVGGVYQEETRYKLTASSSGGCGCEC